MLVKCKGRGRCPKDKWIQMFSLLFINAVLQLFHLYTGKVSISIKDEIAESRGVLEHWSDKITYYTKLKITPKTRPKNFCILTLYRRKQLLTTILLLENKTTVSITLLANWQIPNCPQLRLSPRKYQKKERENMCGFFLSLAFSHTNEVDHKNEQSLTIAKTN